MATTAKAKEATPFSFEDVIKNIREPRDKVLAAIAACFCDAGYSERLINYLTSFPEIFDAQKVMHGVRVMETLGLPDEQLLKRGLSKAEIDEIRTYVATTAQI